MTEGGGDTVRTWFMLSLSLLMRLQQRWRDLYRSVPVNEFSENWNDNAANYRFLMSRYICVPPFYTTIRRTIAGKNTPIICLPLAFGTPYGLYVKTVGCCD